MQVTVDTVSCDTFRKDADCQERVVARAFRKCVDTNSISEHSLTPGERTCIEEYVLLYTQFVRGTLKEFQPLYEQHLRQLFEKARMDTMMAQGKENVKALRKEAA